MEDLSKDIKWSMFLDFEPRDLFRLCGTSKKIRQLCDNDAFWEKYYKIHVDPKYEIARRLKKKGLWKMAFIKNYSEIKTLDFNNVSKDDLWNIEEDNDIKKRSGNYIAVKRKGDIITAIPFFLAQHFVKPGDVLAITLTTMINKTLGKSYLPGKGVKETKGMKIDSHNHLLPVFISDIEIITYPFYHRITIDISKYRMAATLNPELNKFFLDDTSQEYFIQYQNYPSDHRGRRYTMTNGRIRYYGEIPLSPLYISPSDMESIFITKEEF